MIAIGGTDLFIIWHPIRRYRLKIAENGIQILIIKFLSLLMISIFKNSKGWHKIPISLLGLTFLPEEGFINHYLNIR